MGLQETTRSYQPLAVQIGRTPGQRTKASMHLCTVAVLAAEAHLRVNVFGVKQLIGEHQLRLCTAHIGQPLAPRVQPDPLHGDTCLWGSATLLPKPKVRGSAANLMGSSKTSKAHLSVFLELIYLLTGIARPIAGPQPDYSLLQAKVMLMPSASSRPCFAISSRRRVSALLTYRVVLCLVVTRTWTAHARCRPIENFKC